MSHTITENCHVIATDGIAIYHGPTECREGQELKTGQPFALSFETDAEARAFLASLASEPLQWITGYDETHAHAVRDALEADLTWVKAEPIKHPERAEWALPYRADLLAGTSQAMQDGNAQAIADGLNRTPAEMVAEGWSAKHEAPSLPETE